MHLLTRRGFTEVLAGLPVADGAQTARIRESLKITRFDIHKVTLRWRDLVFLEIHTDGGLTGIGEATLENRAAMVEEGLRWLEESMVGLDPSGVEDHWDRSSTVSPAGGEVRWPNTALSAVDMALWDLEGKRLGVPVARLLGGPIHRKLRVYFTHWHASFQPRSPAAFAENTAQTRERG